jgi:hypothetical protein
MNIIKIPLQILLGILICVVIIWLFNFFKYTINRIKRNIKSSPYLIRGNHMGNKTVVIYQDPSNRKSIPLLRSRDEKNGIEYSYTTWLYVSDWSNYKKNEWKHVFHKGDRNSWVNDGEVDGETTTDDYNQPHGAMIASPGMWLHPNTNALRVYVNAYDNMDEYEDIYDIPSQKWLHVSIVVKHQSFDIYINGYLKKKHVCKSIVRQNFGNLYIGNSGGFSGYVSNLRYFDYAVSANEILREVEQGPDSLACADVSGNKPPYLNTNYWQASANAN